LGHPGEAPLLHREAVTTWVRTAFFRKTSKLGLKFAMDAGLRIRWNLAYKGKHDALLTRASLYPKLVSDSELEALYRLFDDIAGDDDSIEYLTRRARRRGRSGRPMKTKSTRCRSNAGRG
jgi:hypothetical protein